MGVLVFSPLSLILLIGASLSFSGCLNATNTLPENGTSIVGSTMVGANGSLASETQCSIFSGDTRDYNTCMGCKRSMCSTCPSSSSCADSILAACNLNMTSLIQCVHENTTASGVCTGLKCGDGQIADFSSCTCKDATPASSYTTTPGLDDTTSPFLLTGINFNNRFCPTKSSASGTSSTDNFDCLRQFGGGASATAPVVAPIYTTSTAANVFADVGYLRWDLALDASQYGPARALDNGLPFMGTWSTIPATVSLFYSLKPNTELDVSTAAWNDCVEHFSSSTSNYLATNNQCNSRNGYSTAIANINRNVALDLSATRSGSAKLENISMNGPAFSNTILNVNTNNNPALLTSASASSVYLGLNKVATSTAASGGSTSSTGAGLLSNIGNYKYTWSNLKVKRPPPATSTLQNSAITSTVAINTNLGFAPGSMVESSALSPNAVGGSVTTRDCSNTAASPYPCVVTSVYRTSGGAVLTQSFSPIYRSTNFDSSSVSTLPNGITAVSTPKIIEDTSQDLSTSLKPARLRVFTRATDGNVYMARYEQGKWNSWLSLGRPWMCGTSASCVALHSAASALPLVYQPFPSTGSVTASAVTSAFVTAGSSSYFTNKDNDGISIAGEPQVVSLMGNTGDSYIAIFVRVSHLNSSDGLAGPWHNAVFYTIAKASGLVSSGGTYSFDNIRSWSPWMPVQNATDTFYVQGNPTVFLSKNTSTASPFIYIFGTRPVNNNTGTGLTGSLLLHPPVAPPSGTSNPANTLITTAHNYHANYGHYLSRSSLNLTTAAVPTTWTGAPLGYYYVWNTISHKLAVTDNHNVIVSDWSYVILNNSLATQTVRVMASQIATDTANLTGCAAGVTYYPHTTTFSTVTVPYSPCYYGRTLAYHEFDFDNTTTIDGSGLLTDCNGQYKTLAFFGTAAPINMRSRLRATSLNDTNPAENDSGTTASAGTRGIIVMGRALCPDKTKCDPVNPVLAYGVINHTTECGAASNPSHEVYYPGAAYEYDSGGGLTASTRTTVQGFYPTSDVIVNYSYGLDVSSADAPFYFMTRDSSGNISHGFFGRSQSGTAGSQMFNVYSRGGFAN